MSFETILTHVGRVGRFQIFIFCIVAIHGLLGALVNVGIVFIAPSVNHWCLVPALSKFNLTQQQYKEIVAPKGEQCKRYDLNFTDMTDLDFTTWNETVDRLKPVLINCDNGWMFDRSMFSYTATEQYSMVCDQSYMISLSSSVYMFGFLVGAVSTGALADRFGRRLTFLVTICLCGVFEIAVSFAVNYSMFLVFRFSYAVMDIGAYCSAFVLGTELLATEYRMYAGVFLHNSFSVGICVLPAFAYFLTNHVWLQLTWGLMYIPYAVFAWFALPESPRWLAAHDRMDEAYVVLKKMARFNKRTIPDQATTEKIIAVQDEVFVEDETLGSRKANILDLIRTRRLRLRTFNVFLNWAVNTMVYYGLTYGVGEFGDDLYLNTFLSGVVEIPCYVVVLFALNKVGRRCLLASALLSSAVCSFIMIGLMEDKGPALVVFAMIGKFAISISFSVIYLFTTEIYPTNIRNVGLGAGSTCARIGGLVAPQIGELKRFWTPLPVAVFGVVSFFGGFFSFFFPETAGRDLPHTVLEAENFGLNEKFTLNCFETVRRQKTRHSAGQVNPAAVIDPEYDSNGVNTIDSQGGTLNKGYVSDDSVQGEVTLTNIKQNV